MTANPAPRRPRGAARLCLGASILLAAILGAAPARAQDAGAQAPTSDVVRGQVTDSTGAPIAGASVAITGLESQRQRTTHTDDKGRYSVLFAEADGEYVVVVRAIGYQPQGVRIRRAPESNSPFLVANIVMGRTVVVLDTIAVNGRDPRSGDRTVGSASSDVTRGALFSLDPSDLEALAARAPGVARLGDDINRRRGYSALGASPDQNRITVDGSTVVSPQLPPDAIAKATLSQTTFDPSQGNFAGAQLAVITRGGSDFPTGSLNVDFADPRLAWEDPSAPTNLARTVTWRGTTSGPIRRGRAYFNIAGLGTNSTGPSLSLLSLRQAQRVQYGLSLDSISAVQGALSSLGLPPRPSTIPAATTNSSQTAFARFDFIPSGSSAIALSLNGDDQRQLGGGLGPLSFPSLAGGSGARGASAQLTGSAVLHGVLDDFSASAGTRSSRGHPLLAVPHGIVRMGTEFPGGQTGITQVDFGGSSSGRNDSRIQTLSFSDGLTWVSPGGRHRVNLGTSLDLQRNLSNVVRDPFGTYMYQSWSDLAANRPASFSRTIAASALDSRTTSNALWIGAHTTARKSALQLEYGLRLDLARASTVPSYNATADSAFGIRTDRVPKALGVTPRLGFNWRLNKPGPLVQPIALAGGVGGFRGVIPPTRVAGLTNQTGLPDATRQLTCAGDATPVPDWQSYASNAGAAPTQCLDGTAATAFGSTAPAIAVFDPSYQPPTAWRGNLALTGLTVHGWVIGFNSLYSITVHNESSVDLNLRRTPLFQLPAERDRPVYVAPDAIVPGTGAISQAGSRIDSRFAGVTSYRSDLRLIGGQFMTGATPSHRLFGTLDLGLQYAFNYGRAERRAFDQEGSTAGDPFARDWAAISQPSHQIMVDATVWLHHLSFASLKLGMNLSSGQRYTPIVGGDVNGDGRLDDRAFIFDPAAAADTALGRQMSALLQSATRTTRRCLVSQLGRIAGANSCSTGWRLQPQVGVDLNLPWQNLGKGALDDHVHLNIATSNAVGALVRLLHLEHSALGSLTAANYPTDPVLAYVTGFDPATRTFRYQINQQFGEGRSQRVRSARYSGAFQVGLGGELHFGGPPVLRLVEQMGLVPSDRKAPLYARDELRRKLRTQVASPYALLLRVRDTLLLTDAQIAELTRLDEGLQHTVDSAFAPLVDYVAAHGRRTPDRVISKHMEQVFAPFMKLLTEETPRAIATVLTDQQIERLPEYLKPLVAARRQKLKQ